MKLIDLHSDTIYQLWKTRDHSLLHNPERHIDLECLKKADSLVQCFALFNDDLYPDTFVSWLEFVDFYKSVLADYPDKANLILNYADIERTRNEGKVGIMMTVEDARICLGDLDRLNIMYERGVRMASLCWNGETCFCYPNSADPKLHMLGLKPLGREAVERINDLGMVFDVSHLNRGGTLEALSISKKPVIASHSNARAVTEQQRNLTDEEIRGIAASGGVIGVNFCPEFLSSDGEADFEKTEKHIAYLAKVGGDGVVAIGTDFDGFHHPHQGVHEVSEMPLLAEALRKMGYKESFIEGLYYKNALRVFKEVLK